MATKKTAAKAAKRVTTRAPSIRSKIAATALKVADAAEESLEMDEATREQLKEASRVAELGGRVAPRMVRGRKISNLPLTFIKRGDSRDV